MEHKENARNVLKNRSDFWHGGKQSFPSTEHSGAPEQGSVRIHKIFLPITNMDQTEAQTGTQTMGYQKPRESIPRPYQNGGEGFVIFYDRLEHMAKGRIDIPKIARLQDYLNEKPTKGASGRIIDNEERERRRFLIVEDAEWLYLDTDRMKYEQTQLTMREGRRDGLLPAKDIDIVYPLDDFKDEEKARKFLASAYKIDIGVSLHRLDKPIEGQIYLSDEYKDREYLHQVRDILGHRNFIAILDPQNKDLESRIYRATGETIQRPILVNTNKIRHVELRKRNGSVVPQALQ